MRRLIYTDEWISQKTASGILNLSKQRISAMVKAGKFDTVTIDEHVFLNKKEVEEHEPARSGRPRKDV